MLDTTYDMSDDQRGGISVDVELGAALALADMAATGSTAGAGLSLGPTPTPAKRGDDPVPAAQQKQRDAAGEQQSMTDEEEMESTRLSLELGKASIHSCSWSSAGRPAAPAVSRPRHILTEAEKEAKRVRRVLANRESARQTILRRQAIRDELARKVADLSSQNEKMKKEKDLVMQEYLSLKETNKQLRAQQQQHHLSLSLF